MERLLARISDRRALFLAIWRRRPVESKCHHYRILPFAGVKSSPALDERGVTLGEETAGFPHDMQARVTDNSGERLRIGRIARRGHHLDDKIVKKN